MSKNNKLINRERNKLILNATRVNKTKIERESSINRIFCLPLATAPSIYRVNNINAPISQEFSEFNLNINER